MALFNLQGHRGARGLKPENTLPAFETAFDLCVSSIETDVHLTKDGVPVLIHDPQLNDLVYRLAAHGGPALPGPAYRGSALVSILTLNELRNFLADGNPDPTRFARQDSSVTPLAKIYADQAGIHPYTVPTVSDLFAFAQLYASTAGQAAGKSETQRARARQVQFDLELKRVPFYPAAIGDHFDNEHACVLECRLLDAIHASGMVSRTAVRSFDHRSVRALRDLDPELTAATLIAETAPVVPEQLVRAAYAQIYCPDYRFLDEWQVRRLHEDGISVLPWTVNRPEDWERLLDWKVDGITTDYPDELASFLKERVIAF
jgi:glycerophosphoryl diester phosphodiesterase